MPDKLNEFATQDILCAIHAVCAIIFVRSSTAYKDGETIAQYWRVMIEVEALPQMQIAWNLLGRRGVVAQVIPGETLAN